MEQYSGKAIFNGTAIGRILFYSKNQHQVKRHKVQDVEAEIARFEAAKEIAMQIRLRNISGIIIIDFINMEDKENETKLKEILRELLSNDPVQTELVEITKLGLVELTRKKICKTLAEQLADAQ